MSEAIATAQADFDKAVPLLSVVNSLAETFAGDIYRKISGTIETVQAWTTDHPEVVAAAQSMASMLPDAGLIVPGLNFGLHVLGALGRLMAVDSTVKGPAAAP